MKYDLLLVGAGITSATCAAIAKRNGWRVCVVETRGHLGGNCYDWQSQGTYIHQYGPHIFHSHSTDIVKFLSEYTSWIPYEHSVVAEVEHDGRLEIVPFPYCRQTERVLGRPLSEQEVIDYFFRGYSEKMWGMTWESLPTTIKARVPKDTQDRPVYFPGQFVALPEKGFSFMLENMFDGIDVRLSAGPSDWRSIAAHRTIYTGRIDHLLGESPASLGFRSLDIEFVEEGHGHSAVTNYCSRRRTYTRKTCYQELTGGQSELVSYESPRDGTIDELAPFYPVPTAENLQYYAELKKQVCEKDPGLILAGRLATYKYLDMDQAVGQAIAICQKRLGIT